MAVVINKDNFEKEIAQSKLPVIIDVFATWCGPCQQMMPIFHELEQEIGSRYKFAKINVDEARELSIQYGVTSVPTFIFIQDNQVKAKETGYMSKEELIEKIEDVFK